MNRTFSLDGKTILVTGASSGIGRQVALNISNFNAKIILTGRNVPRLEDTASLCGNNVNIIPQDLCEIEKLPNFIKNIAKRYGKIDGFAHCAGIELTLPVRAIQPKQINNVITVNSIAPLMLMKGFASRGVHSNQASAVFISSISGHVGNKGLVGYAMSKGALEQMVKCLAIELKYLNIRVNAVAPAQVDTPMLHKYNDLISSEQRFANEAMHPSGIGNANDVAYAVQYLLSDASIFVTGTSLLVDGGYCAQ